LLEKLKELVPAQDAKVNGSESEPAFGPRASTPSTPATLANISGRLVTSVMSMQGSELPPTEAQVLACQKLLAAYADVMSRWTALRLRL
jgi:hypothetical protein